MDLGVLVIFLVPLFSIFSSFSRGSGSEIQGTNGVCYYRGLPDNFNKSAP